jgi:hypothetical protein
MLIAKLWTRESVFEKSLSTGAPEFHSRACSYFYVKALRRIT